MSCIRGAAHGIAHAEADWKLDGSAAGEQDTNVADEHIPKSAPLTNAVLS